MSSCPLIALFVRQPSAAASLYTKPVNIHQLMYLFIW